MEYELRKMELQSNMNGGIGGSALAGSGNQPDLFKLMAIFDGKGDISVYLALFDREISRMNIVKEIWASIY